MGEVKLLSIEGFFPLYHLCHKYLLCFFFFWLKAEIWVFGKCQFSSCCPGVSLGVSIMAEAIKTKLKKRVLFWQLLPKPSATGKRHEPPSTSWRDVCDVNSTRCAQVLCLTPALSLGWPTGRRYIFWEDMTWLCSSSQRVQEGLEYMIHSLRPRIMMQLLITFNGKMLVGWVCFVKVGSTASAK